MRALILHLRAMLIFDDTLIFDELLCYVFARRARFMLPLRAICHVIATLIDTPRAVRDIQAFYLRDMRCVFAARVVRHARYVAYEYSAAMAATRRYAALC